MNPSQQSSTARRFLFLLASARRDGNTEALARRAAAVLPGSVGQQWLRLSDLPLDEFIDLRHAAGTDGNYPQPSGHANHLLDATLAASDLVFVVPLYWYSLPASAKLYLDHWSGWMRVPGVGFKARMEGKTVWAISTVSDEDQSTVEPLLGSLKLTASYMGMHWGGSLLGLGNRPGDVLHDHGATSAARRFFESVAQGRDF